MKSKSDKNKTQNPRFGFHVSNAGNEIGHRTRRMGERRGGEEEKGRGTGRKVDLQAGFVIAIQHTLFSKLYIARIAFVRVKRKQAQGAELRRLGTSSQPSMLAASPWERDCARVFQDSNRKHTEGSPCRLRRSGKDQNIM